MGRLVVSLIGFQTGWESEHEKLREDTCQTCQSPPPPAPEPCVRGPPYDELMINRDFLGGKKGPGEWWENNEIVFDHFMLTRVSNLC